MFVLRSAFWLTAAFLVIAPHGTDFGASATALKDQAVSAGVKAGEQLIVSQLSGQNRLPDLFSVLPAQSVETSMQDSATELSVVPRPRPAAMG